MLSFYHLTKWLNEEVSGKRLWHFLALVLLGKLCYMGLFLGIVIALDIPNPDTVFQPVPILTWNFLLMLFLVALVEEIRFRGIPIMLAHLANAFFGGKTFWLLLTCLISSWLFGLAHGSYLNLITQGAMGLVFCFVFLKCGGYQRPFKKHLKALAATTLVHFTYNGLMALILLSLGETTF